MIFYEEHAVQAFNKFDKLLQVNGKPVNGVAFREVCQWVKCAPGGRLVLYIVKPHFPLHSKTEDALKDPDILRRFYADYEMDYAEHNVSDLKLLRDGQEIMVFFMNAQAPTIRMLNRA